MNIKTGKQLAQACLNLVSNFKTLYVYGCFGAPMTDNNKNRYLNAQSYNRKPDRKAKILASDSSVYGFDCVGMIKGLLWDWTGDPSQMVYGGADYGKNGVPDLSANAMINLSPNASQDFSNIEVGEVVWMQDHIGVYVGNGLCVECTPRWKDGCQTTAVWNIGTKEGYNGRYWTKHGKLPYIEYESSPEPIPVPEEYTLTQFIKDVQSACHAVVDGVAGPQTLAKTVTVSASYNRTHSVVRPLQKRLYSLGYTVVGTADGCTGPKFTEAVKAYQKNHGCYIDGEITAGSKTWKNLLEMVDDPAPQPEPKPIGYTTKNFIEDVQRACGAKVDGIYGPETLSKTVTVSRWVNDRHAVVKPIQKRLAALGYDEVGSADGVTGPSFYNAIVHFQKKNNCYADGIITAGQKTWQKLLTI